MLAHQQPMISSLRRDAWLEIDLNAIERNITVIRSWLKPNTKLMCVVKGDAYGHGAVGISDILLACGADYLGVASVDEGCQLRETGISLPILLLSPCPSWAISTALEANLTLTITSKSQLIDLAYLCQRQSKEANIHLKLDTGMHRLGLARENIQEIIELIKENKLIKLTGIFSHLAKAEEKEFTEFQKNEFELGLHVIKKIFPDPGIIHLASGEAARNFPFTHYNMVRVGLYIYGLEANKISDIVQPVMSVRGRINHTQTICQGESVGYNLTWTASRPTRIASVPTGYADGIDRGLSNQICGLLLGKKIKQIGLISMDQMLFDITDVPEAQEGDVITLIGNESHLSKASDTKNDQLYLADWANKLNTITYELASRLRIRMPRIYTRQENQ